MGHGKNVRHINKKAEDSAISPAGTEATATITK